MKKQLNNLDKIHHKMNIKLKINRNLNSKMKIDSERYTHNNKEKTASNISLPPINIESKIRCLT